jgi:Tfp pilus assembly protein PilF
VRHLEAVRRMALAGVALAVGMTVCSCAGASAPAQSSTAHRFDALLGSGRLLLQQGNTNGARQLFEQAVEMEPRSAIARYDLGVLFAQEGRNSQALTEYRLALARDPHYVPALYNEATIVSPKTPFKAMALYRKVIRLQPDSATALLNLGLLEVAAPHEEILGIVDLRHALKLEPALASSIPASVRSQVESQGHATVPSP